MCEIPIFIASSVKEFEQERKELSDFLNIINDVYRDTGIQLVWDRPENMSHEVKRGGSQLSYDQKILNSRYFILLVGRNLGEYTRWEYELALDQFVLTGAPKILPYFYAADSATLPPDVLTFQDRLRREQQYYTHTFTDFETLKRTIQLDLEKSGAFARKTPKPDSVESLLEQVQVKVRREIERILREIEWTQKQTPSERLFVLVTRQYEDMVRLVQKSHQKPDALLEYMVFLRNQHMPNRAIELGRWLENVYRNEAPGVEILARLNRQMGDCCDDSNLKQQSETYYRESLIAFRRLAEEDPATFEPDVAETCNNYGELLRVCHRMEEAEQYYQEALIIRRHLAEANPVAYNPYVADTLGNLGILCCMTNRMQEAEMFYQEMITIRRQLVKRNPIAFEPRLAQDYNNYGILLKNTNRTEDAERFYQDALEIRRRLAKENPGAYNPYVAGTVENLANLQYATNRKEEAETNYLEALHIRRKLAKVNPGTYEPYVAQTCYHLGVLEGDKSNQDSARCYFTEALALYEKFPHCESEAQMCRDELAKL